MSDSTMIYVIMLAVLFLVGLGLGNLIGRFFE